MDQYNRHALMAMVRFHDKIPKRKISNRKISNAIYRSRKISKLQNIDGAKYRKCRISNRKISNMHNIESQNIECAKYRRTKYRKQNIERQNIEVAKYRTQNIEVAKYRTQNIEVAKYRKQNTEKVKHRKLKLRAPWVKMTTMLCCSFVKYQAEHGGLEVFKDNVAEPISSYGVKWVLLAKIRV